MKIPESVRIAGVEFEVKYVPNLNNGTNLAYGYIDYENSTISLSDTNGTEHQRRCQILWHEILHGIRENNGMEIENEEAVVDMFARGIYQVLQDNGARFFDLERCTDGS
jgi:outer membrane receptor protein involved in Fe transport